MNDPNAKKLTDMTADELRSRIVDLTVELDGANKAHREIVALAAGWDEDGAIGPRDPMSWETVGRLAMDISRYALTKERCS